MSRDISNDAKHDVARVQEQLLDMLRMAGNEAPPPRREVPAVAVMVAPPVIAPVKVAASPAATVWSDITTVSPHTAVGTNTSRFFRLKR